MRIPRLIYITALVDGRCGEHRASYVNKWKHQRTERRFKKYVRVKVQIFTCIKILIMMVESDETRLKILKKDYKLQE